MEPTKMKNVLALAIMSIFAIFTPNMSFAKNLHCELHPSTWENSLANEELKQWPEAAETQHSINLSGVYTSSAPEGQTCRQQIWQECLELTINGGCTDNVSGKVVSGSPLHHYVLDFSYGHADQIGSTKCDKPTNGNCYESFGPTLNKGLIVRTTRDWCEKYHTEDAVMLVGPLLTGANSGPGAVGWNAVRAIDSNGSLIFMQNPDAAETGTTAETVMPRSTTQFVKCGHQGFDQSLYCKKRSYLDSSWSFTPACCSAYKGDISVFTKFMDLALYPSTEVEPFPDGPNVVACDKSTTARKF